MAKITDVRSILSRVKMTVSRKNEGKYIIKFQDLQLSLTESYVNQYLEVKASIMHPVETAIFIPGYYEQAVDVQGRVLELSRLFRDQDEIVLENKDKTRKILVAGISSLFSLSLVDAEDLPNDIRRIMNFARLRFRHRDDYPRETPPDFKSLFSRFRTVRVITNIDDPLARNWNKLQALAEAALFHIAYGTGIGINLSVSWGRAYYRFGLRRKETVQFPLRTYNSELLAYYHLAFGSESLILAYLAFYKILEYFFTSSSERLLHEKITQKLVEPDFAHTKTKKLRELVKTIRIHDSKVDERRMLRTVLEHYFNSSELRNWVLKFEEENGQYFTQEQDIFAERIKLDLSDEQIFLTTANRIYHIRNALVHYKEGEVSRFIPFSGQEQLLHRELPLLLYLAEQVIIKTGKDIV